MSDAPNPNPSPNPNPDPNPNPNPAPNPNPNPNPNPAPNPDPSKITADDKGRGDWPEDWRVKMAGGDEKKSKLLERYGSPLAAVDALADVRTKISKGELRVVKPLSDKPSDEEIAEYRASNGIPESADKYDTALGDGHVWGDADKPLLESFTKAAHDAHIPGSHLKPILKWYDGLQQKQAEERQNADAQFKKDNVDVLRDEWGADYRKEVKVVDEFFDSLPDGLGEILLNARDANGRPLGANAALLKWANRMQHEANPLATVLPGSGQGSAQAMETEIANLRKLMGDKQSEYWKGPNAAKNQQRYRDLLDAQAKAGKKAA